MLAGSCCGVGGELGVSGAVPADPGEGEAADDEGGVVEVLVVVAVVAAPVVGAAGAASGPAFGAQAGVGG